MCQDRETGLHYNYFRDYDPGTGRYIESDPIGLDGGSNLYTYGLNNPLTYTDPTGEIVFVLPAIPPALAALSNAALATAGILGLSALAENLSDGSLQESIEREANRREYKNICNEPPPPGLDQCELAQWNLKKAQSCKNARDENTKKWWGGVDNQHSSQLEQDLNNSIRNAQAAIDRACKCKK